VFAGPLAGRAPFGARNALADKPLVAPGGEHGWASHPWHAAGLYFVSSPSRLRVTLAPASRAAAITSATVL
jgi:hypothetical protein